MAKVKKLKQKVKLDDDLVTMFNQMLDGEGDPTISIEKYFSLIGLVTDLSKIMEIFNNATIKDDDVTKFIVDSRLAVTLQDGEEQLEHYSKLKNSEIVRLWIKSLKDIVPYKNDIEMQLSTLPKVIFIETMAAEWDPFAFSSVNLVEFIRQLPDGSDNVKKLVLLSLSKVIDKGCQVFKLVTTPDINVKEFAKKIATALESVKKRPELSRCDKAFKKITDSLEMFEDNFGDYYKDFLHTQNSSIILENFVLDVSKTIPNDPELTRQFRVIIKWLRDATVKATKHNKSIPKHVSEKTNTILGFLDKLDAGTAEGASTNNN